jgi:thioredoxin-dependent peroxiredoxin
MTTSQRKKAPPFSAASSLGTTVSLDDYRGRYLVLYFYPASFTYGCTRETIKFRDATAEFAALGADIVGVSPDAVEVQCKFGEHYQAKFPILSDPDSKIAQAYEVVFPLLTWLRRVTVVIDPEGYIRARFRHELLVEKHIDDALQYLKSVRAGAVGGSVAG